MTTELNSKFKELIKTNSECDQEIANKNYSKAYELGQKVNLLKKDISSEMGATNPSKFVKRNIELFAPIN